VLGQETLTKTLLQQKQPRIKQGFPVEKKVLLTAAFVSMLLLSALVGIQLVNLGRANPLPDYDPNITIENPQNATYNVNSFTLNFTVAAWWRTFPCGYSLDGEKMRNVENMTIVSVKNWFSAPYPARTTLKGSCILSNLAEGWHNANVSYFNTYKFYSFKVDTSAKLFFISILSPVNKVYNTSDVPLNFAVNESTSHFSYNLDGKENLITTGNMTLLNLSHGSHHVTVYSKDTWGNVIASEPVTFTIDTFPTALVVASAVSTVAVIGVGLLVYLKKRKR
jgi:hypothetical protein